MGRNGMDGQSPAARTPPASGLRVQGRPVSVPEQAIREWWGGIPTTAEALVSRSEPMSAVGRVAVVWFKRDLRLHDHAALAAAARFGRVLPLFIQEPDLLAADDIDASTIEFANGCLAELDRGLQGLGGRLIVRQGDAIEVLDRLWDQVRFAEIHAHEETGGERTYARDLAVGRWC